METILKSYQTSQVRKKLTDYGYREKYRTARSALFRNPVTDKNISIPVDKERMTDNDLRLALGQSPIYYSVVWNLEKRER
ncbi:MAG: hypothetical protein K9J17_05555 [Flavobacteriales bacterium]|nr:hypothetical protein [Flavobacteriales bacterium]